MSTVRVFISSVQKEFAEERAALRDYLRGDPLMRRFFETFLFEEVPAEDRRADALYLAEVERCDFILACSATNTVRRMQKDFHRRTGNLSWLPVCPGTRFPHTARSLPSIGRLPLYLMSS